MSEDTRRDLRDALRAHIADEAEGAYLTDFAVIAAASPPEDADATRYIHERSDSPYHTLLGLLHLGHQHLLDGWGDDE